MLAGPSIQSLRDHSGQTGWVARYFVILRAATRAARRAMAAREWRLLA